MQNNPKRYSPIKKLWEKTYNKIRIAVVFDDISAHLNPCERTKGKIIEGLLLDYGLRHDAKKKTQKHQRVWGNGS